MKRIVSCCVCWAVFACCSGNVSDAKDGAHWTRAGHVSPKDVTLRYIGPGSGGAMFGVDFQPGNPNVIIFGGDMGAMYRTENGGKSWTIVGDADGHPPGRGGVWTVKFDRRRPQIVWSGGAGAFRSVDAGRTWRQTTQMNVTIGAVGLDPDDSDIVYIAEGFVPRIVIGWVRGRVWKTTDGGKTWKELPRPAGDLKTDAVKARNWSRREH